MDVFNDREFSRKKVEKGTILLSKGSIAKCAYKVIKGCLKSYVIDQSGKEHIIQFAPEDWIITDMDSLFNAKPTAIFIEAIETSEVLMLDGALFNSVDDASPTMQADQRNKLVRNLISLNRRLINLLSSTAGERYQDFVETYPSLVQRVPLKMIASYIGVTPEYLSDIRRKMAKK